jgi:hypothetical protein
LGLLLTLDSPCSTVVLLVRLTHAPPLRSQLIDTASPPLFYAADLDCRSSASTKRASRFHHTCSSPHSEQRECIKTSGNRLKPALSVSVPVFISWPVLGHLIRTAPMSRLLRKHHCLDRSTRERPERFTKRPWAGFHLGEIPNVKKLSPQERVAGRCLSQGSRRCLHPGGKALVIFDPMQHVSRSVREFAHLPRTRPRNGASDTADYRAGGGVGETPGGVPPNHPSEYQITTIAMMTRIAAIQATCLF